MPMSYPTRQIATAKIPLVLFPMLILNIDLVNLTGNMCTCIYL